MGKPRAAKPKAKKKKTNSFYSDQLFYTIETFLLHR